jgi:hypothetical protein
MSIESFSLLMDLVGPQIRRQDTNFRTALSAEERLLITLRQGKFIVLLIYKFCKSLNKYKAFFFSTLFVTIKLMMAMEGKDCRGHSNCEISWLIPS